MKRVLFLESHADLIGGGQLSLLDLARRLEQYAPVCACPAGGGLEAALWQAGIPVVALELPPLRVRRLAAVLTALVRLCRLVRREDVALLHANSSRAMFYGGLAGRLVGVPVVWHVRVAHDDGAWDRVLARWADRLAVISRAVERRFAGLPVADRVRLVYNGVDLEPYARADRASARRSLGWGDRPVVGMVAQLVPVKRHADFLQMAARLAPRHPEALFAAAGSDPEPGGAYGRGVRELAGELGLADRLTFLGFYQDMAGLMAALDVVVLCSEMEAFGRVLVEAMAAGRPVVATAVGGIPEVVVDGQTGLLVPAGDVEALARAVSSLLEDPGRARTLGEAGQGRARDRFSLEAHVEAVQNLYRELLGE